MKNKCTYLDNAATSFPKPKCVLKETLEFFKKYGGNPGRSAHKISLAASERVFSVREKVASLVGCVPERVVFTSGATQAINLAMKTGIEDGAHILISDMEHNSVFRVAHALRQRCGVEYSIFDSECVEKSLNTLVTPKTTHIISSLASNVSGKKIELKILSDFAKKHGIGLILDASQLLGHEELSLKDINFNVLCCAGHKALFGIQGVGFAIFGKSIPQRSFIEGGSGADSKNPNMPSELPEKYEAGTLPTPAIVSLGAGIDFISSHGISQIEKKLSLMTDLIKDRVTSINGIDLCEGEGGIISFTHKKIPSEILAARLDEHGICVRGGFHCSPLMHKKLGTYENGAVRVSLSCLNSLKDLDKFFVALKSAL